MAVTILNKITQRMTHATVTIKGKITYTFINTVRIAFTGPLVMKV